MGKRYLRVCEFSDGREGKKRRGGHWRWEEYGWGPERLGNRPSGPQLVRE